MSRIMVDLRSRTPIFEQIVASVENLVLKGILSPDEQLPSVRHLAGELGINPNTIQKAYAELERQGIVYSVPGKGSFVSSNVKEVKHAHKNEILARIEELAVQARDGGVSKEEIIAAINKSWR